MFFFPNPGIYEMAQFEREELLDTHSEPREDRHSRVRVPALIASFKNRPSTEFLVHLLDFPSIYWISRPSTGFPVHLLDFPSTRWISRTNPSIYNFPNPGILETMKVRNG